MKNHEDDPVRRDATLPEGESARDDDPPAVWRYSDMCRHWSVSRTTVERWVRRYEEHGEGIPVHRDPSGRPYWLPEEAAAPAVASSTVEPAKRMSPVARSEDERLERLRRAARRGHRVA